MNHSVDDTFEALRRTPFEKLKRQVENYTYVHATTFYLTIGKSAHNVIRSNGWTIKEFEDKLNQL